MTKTPKNYICLAPKVAGLLFAAFLALFSLDVISPEASISQILLGLLIHNIPVFVLLAVLVIAWRHEIVGSIVFALAGVLYILLIGVSAFRQQFAWYMVSWCVFIAGPAFGVSFLYYYCWRKKRTDNIGA